MRKLESDVMFLVYMTYMYLGLKFVSSSNNQQHRH